VNTSSFSWRCDPPRSTTDEDSPNKSFPSSSSFAVVGTYCRTMSYVDWSSVRIPHDGVEIPATRGEGVSISSPIIELSEGGQSRARCQEEIDPGDESMDPRMDSETAGDTPA